MLRVSHPQTLYLQYYHTINVDITLHSCNLDDRIDVILIFILAMK